MGSIKEIVAKWQKTEGDYIEVQSGISADARLVSLENVCWVHASKHTLPFGLRKKVPASDQEARQRLIARVEKWAHREGYERVDDV